MDLYVLAFVRRKGSHLTVLQSYLNEHYSQRVHIYTDGSATATTAGSGVYIESINKRYAITLTQTTSSFSSKLYAIPRSLLPFYMQIYESSNPHR